MCNSSSSVLVLNRTSPSLLHTFVAYTTQLSIAIQHTGNSYLHQHIPRSLLRASSIFFNFPVSRARPEKNVWFLLAAASNHVHKQKKDTASAKEGKVSYKDWYLDWKYRRGRPALFSWFTVKKLEFITCDFVARLAALPPKKNASTRQETLEVDLYVACLCC